MAKTLPSREIKAGDLALDSDAGVPRKGKTAVQLRPKVTKLLTLFMGNRGTVLNRHEIMDKVWETDCLEDTCTLNVHVCWLRAKTEDDPAAPRYLRTVRGVGYRFDVPESISDLTPADAAV